MIHFRDSVRTTHVSFILLAGQTCHVRVGMRDSGKVSCLVLSRLSFVSKLGGRTSKGGVREAILRGA